MIFVYYLLVSIFLIVAKTTVFSFIPLFKGFYDPLIPLVIYLALYRRPREGLSVLGVVGFIMDYLSGGPFGIYLTTYAWLFAGVRGMIRILRLNRGLISLFVVACGVMFENLIYFVAMGLGDGHWLLSGSDMHIIFSRLLWALITGPFLLMLIDLGLQKWEVRMHAFTAAGD